MYLKGVGEENHNDDSELAYRYQDRARVISAESLYGVRICTSSGQAGAYSMIFDPTLVPNVRKPMIPNSSSFKMMLG